MAYAIAFFAFSCFVRDDVSCYAAKSYNFTNYNLCGAGILPALYIQIRRLTAYLNLLYRPISIQLIINKCGYKTLHPRLL
jgi:hypothetical protein